jgi:alkanesulfonate monooxygenase SsuD/methylene tetrahydromethanopterin reductase-like flavin-dependent oxidoreductase (luciferase family)
MLSSATFRLPGPLAVTVAQVDAMSGGRVELGLGAGWFEAEHLAYGIPFPPVGERFDRLEEQLQIITGLWETPDGKTYDFTGTHYELRDSPALPKPVQSPRPPIIVGGHGPKRTPRLAATSADEFNVAFSPPAEAYDQLDRVRAACDEQGRDRATLRMSLAQVLCCGRDGAEVRRRADAIGKPVERVRADELGGTPAELVDRLGDYAAHGVQRVYLQTLDLTDLDHLELVASEVMRQL